MHDYLDTTLDVLYSDEAIKQLPLEERIKLCTEHLTNKAILKGLSIVAIFFLTLFAGFVYIAHDIVSGLAR